MRILIGMSHPKHVYMFKNFIKGMEKRGHEIKILAIKKDITENLLRQFKLPYTIIGKNPPSIYKKILSVPKWEYLTLKFARKFNADIYIGQALPNFAHVSAILKKPYIIFEDTEIATTVQKVCFPFANSIVTPSCYKTNLGKKHVIFEGFYELAYLHPNYFTPDPTILADLGVGKNDKYIVMRFVGWNALHDIGQRGFDTEMTIKLIKELEKYAKVFITSENLLPKELKNYEIKTSPERIHDLLYYADLYIGEGATMASEAAILGTPSIYISSLTGYLGNIEELEKKYELMQTFDDPLGALNTAIEMLNTGNLKEKWNIKREKLLNDKIDVTKFMIDFIDNYHKGFYDYKMENVTRRT